MQHAIICAYGNPRCTPRLRGLEVGKTRKIVGFPRRPDIHGIGIDDVTQQVVADAIGAACIAFFVFAVATDEIQNQAVIRASRGDGCCQPL